MIVEILVVTSSVLFFAYQLVALRAECQEPTENNDRQYGD